MTTTVVWRQVSLDQCGERIRQLEMLLVADPRDHLVRAMLEDERRLHARIQAALQAQTGDA